MLCLVFHVPMLGMAAFAQPQKGRAIDAASISEATDAIYAIVVQELVNHPDGESNPTRLVFLASTAPEPCFEEKKDQCPTMIKRGLEKAFPKQLQSETIQSFLSQNKTVSPLSTTFHTSLPRVFITSQEEFSFFNPTGPIGWESFYKRYPRSGGLLALSKVGFNTRYDQALVYSENSCGGLCGSGYYNLLKKKDGKWILVKRYMAWIS
jgi:hypothetical protein